MRANRISYRHCAKCQYQAIASPIAIPIPIPVRNNSDLSLSLSNNRILRRLLVLRHRRRMLRILPRLTGCASTICTGHLRRLRNGLLLIRDRQGRTGQLRRHLPLRDVLLLLPNRQGRAGQILRHLRKILRQLRKRRLRKVRMILLLRISLRRAGGERIGWQPTRPGCGRTRPTRRRLQRRRRRTGEPAASRIQRAWPPASSVT